MTAGEPWYVEAFRSEYRAVYPHRDLPSARVEVAALCAQGIEGRVLDLCCGFGRHTLALLERGLDACGLDLSPELLESARQLPGAELLRGRLVRGDARALPLRTASFDALLNLFSSFGYFGADGDRALLAEAARVLKPGGRALFDLMNAQRVRAALVPRSRSERGEWTVLEQRSLAEDGRVVRKDVELLGADGTRRAWREEVRLYEPSDFEALLRGANLRLLRYTGDFEGELYGPRSARMLAWAERSG